MMALIENQDLNGFSIKSLKIVSEIEYFKSKLSEKTQVYDDDLHYIFWVNTCARDIDIINNDFVARRGFLVDTNFIDIDESKGYRVIAVWKKRYTMEMSN